MVKISISGVPGMPKVITICSKDLESGLQKAYKDLVQDKTVKESEGE